MIAPQSIWAEDIFDPLEYCYLHTIDIFSQFTECLVQILTISCTQSFRLPHKVS